MQQNRKFNAYIFDLDGVLVDTAVYHYQAWKKLANFLGFDFTVAQNEELKGISRIDSLKKILNWGNLNINDDHEIHRLANIKNDDYVSMIEKMTAEEVLPGALAFLNLTKEQGIKIALGSASKNSSIILKRTEIASFFDVIVDGNAVSKSKPNPEVFIKAQQLLGVFPHESVVFEDAAAGIKAAKLAQMKVVGIGSEIILREADLIVPNLKNMTPQILEAKL
jgi:beta-phosphoglucomutase